MLNIIIVVNVCQILEKKVSMIGTFSIEQYENFYQDISLFVFQKLLLFNSLKTISHFIFDFILLFAL